MDQYQPPEGVQRIDTSTEHDKRVLDEFRSAGMTTRTELITAYPDAIEIVKVIQVGAAEDGQTNEQDQQDEESLDWKLVLTLASGCIWFSWCMASAVGRALYLVVEMRRIDLNLGD